jgi:hypothetical protein
VHAVVDMVVQAQRPLQLQGTRLAEILFLTLVFRHC